MAPFKGCRGYGATLRASFISCAMRRHICSKATPGSHGSEDGRWHCSLARRPSRWRSPIASGPIEPFLKRFAPALSDESVWHRYFFIGAPKDSYVYLECHLTDGGYVAGPLVWYNTDLEDSPDRDLVIGQPLTLLGPDGEPTQGSPGAQAILSAREIRQIVVTYVDRSTIDLEEGRSSGLTPGASEPLGTVSDGPRMSE